MIFRLQKTYAFMILVSILLTAGCTGTPSNPEDAIEAYYNALISSEIELLANLSCTEWEASARAEMDSFNAVSATLEGFSCQELSAEDGTTLISCNGKIVANYGDEILEIDMSDRTYIARYESGEWRMCGYQ